MSIFWYLSLIVISVFVFRFFQYRRRTGGLPLPPGPPSLPLLGHALAIPSSYDGKVYADWSKKYGDVIYLNVLGNSMIMLNSHRAATDLLDKRSSIYSDRPWFAMFEMIGWTDMLSFLPYNDEFHHWRKMFQQLLAKKECAVFQDSQLRQSRILLKNLLDRPEKFPSHFTRFATSLVMEITYGHRIETDEDPYLNLAREVDRMLNGSGNPGASPVDFFPILRHLPAWFPGAWFIRYGEENRPKTELMKDYGFNEVCRKMSAGTAEISFLSMHLEQLIREGRDTEEERLRMRSAAFHLYGGDASRIFISEDDSADLNYLSAGGETTWNSTETFILAMLVHPEAQKKAHAELDRVVGSGRLPDFSDRETLPYIDCIVQETLRRYLVAPLGIPHRVMSDDVYRGMFIPKGSTIIANAACISMDEAVYHNPTAFFPERFLPKPEGHGEPYPELAFGFGRRICPGRHLADASIWIAVASILSVFDILPAKDDSGNDIIPTPQFRTVVTSHPKPFKCIIRPRSAQARALIEAI